MAFLKIYFGNPVGAVIEAVEEPVKTGTGGIDPGEGIRRRRRHKEIIKPTGLLPVKPKKALEERTAEIAEIHQEVIAEAKREFLEPPSDVQILDVTALSQAEILARLEALKRKETLSDEDLLVLIILIAASV